MYKKLEKEIIYDHKSIANFNINTKKSKKYSHTWILNVFPLCKPERPKEIDLAMNDIQGFLGKFGSPPKDLGVSCLAESQMKSEPVLPTKAIVSEELPRINNGGLKKIDIKTTKKSDENRRIIDSTSMISLNTKLKLEELENKVLNLKKEINYDHLRRKASRKHTNSNVVSKLIFPRIKKIENFSQN